MVRRIHVSLLYPGEVPLDAAEAHHTLDVLRLTSGTEVEVFDDGGRVASGVIVVAASGVGVRVETVREAREGAWVHLTIAAAVPKGDRADWMVQKLSELGVSRFVPLATERSVVLPAGKNKTERWGRLAVEAAKQSRRTGVMEIAEMSAPETLIASLQSSGWLSEAVWYLSTGAGTKQIIQLLRDAGVPERLTLMVGPEGGWTEQEMVRFDHAGAVAVGLTSTVLRVETAAIAASAIIECWQR